MLIAFNLYRVLGGIGVGLASAVCPMYIARLPFPHPRHTGVVQPVCIIFGMLVVYFVNYMIMGDHQNPVILKDAVSGVMSVSPESDMWSVYEGWRYMFGSEAFPAALFGLLLFCVPKTPRYLVMCGEDERAFAILEKINGRNVAGRYWRKSNRRPRKRLKSYSHTVWLSSSSAFFSPSSNKPSASMPCFTMPHAYLKVPAPKEAV